MLKWGKRSRAPRRKEENGLYKIYKLAVYYTHKNVRVDTTYTTQCLNIETAYDRAYAAGYKVDHFIGYVR